MGKTSVLEKVPLLLVTVLAAGAVLAPGAGAVLPLSQTSLTVVGTNGALPCGLGDMRIRLQASGRKVRGYGDVWCVNPNTSTYRINTYLYRDNQQVGFGTAVNSGLNQALGVGVPTAYVSADKGHEYHSCSIAYSGSVIFGGGCSKQFWPTGVPIP